MRWCSWLITVTAFQLVTAVCGREQTFRAPDQAGPSDHAQATEGFHIRRGTLVVAIMETNQIVIAIDSRVTANRPSQTNSTEDAVEKVIPLSQHVAFFSTGIGGFATRDSTNTLAHMAKALAADWKNDNRPVELDGMAQDFKARVGKELSRLTIADIGFLHRIATKDGGSNVFQAVFAGRDSDAAFRMFQVTCHAIVETNGGKMDAHLSFDVTERKRIGKQWILFFGVTKVFGHGMSDPTAPLAPFMKQLRTSHALLAEPVAASLAAAGLRELGDAPESPVGYPIFVYALDGVGFRLTRKVNKGQPVTFDPRDQGK